MDVFADPVIQSAALPLAVSLAATGLLAWSGGPRWGAAGIGCGLLAAYGLIIGLPAWPAVTALGKAGWLLLTAIPLALAASKAETDPIPHGPTLTAAVWSLAGLTWMVQPLLHQGEREDFLHLGGVIVAGLLLGGLFLRNRTDPGADLPRHGPETAAMLLAASLGLTGVAFFGASAALAQLAAALAAATGGWLLWNWPRMRQPFALTGFLTGIGSWLVLATVLALFSQVSMVAMALLLLAFLSRSAVVRLPLPAALATPAVRPLLVGMGALLPAAAAVAVAFHAAAERGGY
mgnify:CR=1 FL=1